MASSLRSAPLAAKGWTRAALIQVSTAGGIMRLVRLALKDCFERGSAWEDLL